MPLPVTLHSSRSLRFSFCRRVLEGILITRATSVFALCWRRLLLSPSSNAPRLTLAHLLPWRKCCAGPLVGSRKSGVGWIALRKGVAHTNLSIFFLFWHSSTFQLLDKPWSQVSSLLPPGSCLQFFLSHIRFSNPTARRFFIEWC